MHHQLLREIYRQAEIDPADTPYVESHCTDSIVGDPEKANCIDQIFCKNRKTPLLIDSVKFNMGHAEADNRLCSIASINSDGSWHASRKFAIFHSKSKNTCIK